MNLDETLPALRPLDITPFRDHEGRVFFELRDGLQIAPRSLAISGAGYFVLAHLDGAHTFRDVLHAFREATGQEIPPEEIARVIAVLDHYAMLATPRFEALYAAWRAEYEAAECRENAGHVPAAEPLRRLIRAVLDSTSAQPRGGHPSGTGAPVRGLIAPHLDYPRGAPCYAAAYGRLLSGAVPERFIILGTNHFGSSTCAVTTNKDFRTPLGRLRTDRDFIARLEQRLGASLREHEYDHRAEHSVELQVQVLQVCFPDANFTIVPILCPSICDRAGRHDAAGPDAGAFADALRELSAADQGRTILIAGADLSHVGVPFGDESSADPAFLAEVERVDRGLLDLLARDDPEGFATALCASSNRTRVCSSGCLYTLRRALPGRPLRILAYHQATNAETDTNVTCAAAVIE